MGCASSVAKPINDNFSKDGVAQSGSPTLFKQIINEKCSLIRLDHPKDVPIIPIKGISYNFNLRYCYVSQKGYYPNALGKANQDSYLVCEGLLNEKSCNYFGVFDGHGEFGDYCSHFAADMLPRYLVDEISNNGGINSLETSKLKNICTRSYLDTNYSMHKSFIDDSLSGTTAVTILQHGDKLTIANAGDSRAIIASEIDGKLKYTPLSSDQTPYRKDERERLKKQGARILTIDQIEGVEPIHENFGTNLGEEIDEAGDPPRVWDKTLEKPGCAFTRSLGDSIAKEIGVTAEPEIMEYSLSPKDKFAVIASDGVFEFITSQSVIDMVNKYNDPIEAAKYIVSEAYRLWLTYDDRTDDITILVIYFDDFEPTGRTRQLSGILGKTGDLTRALSFSKPVTEQFVETKPVRKVLSRAKRKVIMDNWEHQDSEVFDFNSLEDNKSDEEIARISKMINSSFMFQNLSPIQKDQVYKVMVLEIVKKGDVIIKEGDKGDKMYIVDSGEYNVLKRDENGIEQNIFKYTSEGSAFGELSLMYGKPRAASVIASSDGTLWSIGRAAFRAIVMQEKKEGLLEIYRAVPEFSRLSFTELHRLCVNSVEYEYDKGEIIADEHNAYSLNWVMCIILDGVIRLISVDEGKKRQLRAELSFFFVSEIGTKFSLAKADCKTKLACIPIDIYNEILGIKAEVSKKTVANDQKTKGKRSKQSKSYIFDEKNHDLNRISNNNKYILDFPVGLFGEMGFLANFKDVEEETVVTIKVLSKERLVSGKMVDNLLFERNLLAALSQQNDETSGLSSCIPQLIGTFQNDKIINIVFKDMFVCDLSMAINENAISEDLYCLYIACIYDAVTSLHSFGVFHRFLNPGSIFLTHKGVPKIVDYRYISKIDGSKSYTICGDPLYFAPEIVGQQGYDYSIDFWALGVIFYELYEKKNPFGTHESEETSIFRNISSFKPNLMKFESTCPDSVKSTIKRLMEFNPNQRLGYKNSAEFKKIDIFSELNWPELTKEIFAPIEIRPHFESNQLFEETDLNGFSSAKLDQF